MEVKWMRPFYLNELGLCIHEFDSRTGHHYYPIFIKGDKIVAQWEEYDGPEGPFKCTWSKKVSELPDKIIVYNFGKFVFPKNVFLKMVKEWTETKEWTTISHYFEEKYLEKKEE